jgi:cyclase
MINKPSVRIIPRLDIKGPNLVKGIHLEGLRVLGKPERFARLYYEQGADELLYMDVVASLYGRNNLLDIVTRTSQEVFIPVTVGGGLRSLEDIKAVLRAGADKVALNTAALANPELVREAATRFGSSTIVVSIEAIRRPDGRYEAYTNNGREATGYDAIDWAQHAAKLGAGELLVTSIDREGTGQGYDLELTRAIASTVPVPVIACGGAGTLDHVADAVQQGNADAVCLASMLHYEVVQREGVTGDFSSEGNTEFMNRAPDYSRVEKTTLPTLKSHLVWCGIETRPVVGTGGPLEPLHA